MNKIKKNSRKRANITIGEKQAIIARLEGGERVTKVARDLKLNHSTISNIWSAREAIRNAKESPRKSRLMYRYYKENQEDRESSNSPEMSVKLENNSTTVESTLSKSNANNLCRLCLTSTDNILEIFGKVGLLTNISDVIYKLFSLKIAPNDRWPQSICIPCFQKLMDYDAFYATVKVSEKSLIELFGELGNLVEDDTTNTDQLLDYPIKKETCEETQPLEIYELFPEMEDETFIEDAEEENYEKKPRTIEKSNTGASCGSSSKRKLAADEEVAKYINLSCEECSLTFATFDDLTKHFNLQHNQEGYVKCCSLTIKNRPNLLEHVRYHKNPKLYTCNDCGRTFFTHRRFGEHKKTHVPEDEKKFKCDNCPKRFVDLFKLKNHQMMHRPRDQWEHICPQCQKAFPTSYTMRMHVKIKHERSQERVCEICAKVLPNYGCYYSHRRVHMDLPRVKCDLCKKTFKDKTSILRHMQRIHQPAVGIFPCEICGKKYSRKHLLILHRSYAHKEIRFKCNLCEKEFKQAISLKEHMATHSGHQHLYSCNFCDKMFNSNANKYKHQKKMHPKEWEKNRKKDKSNK